jgi:hypothetical protein
MRQLMKEQQSIADDLKQIASETQSTVAELETEITAKSDNIAKDDQTA